MWLTNLSTRVLVISIGVALVFSVLIDLSGIGQKYFGASFVAGGTLAVGFFVGWGCFIRFVIFRKPVSTWLAIIAVVVAVLIWAIFLAYIGDPFRPAVMLILLTVICYRIQRYEKPATNVSPQTQLDAPSPGQSAAALSVASDIDGSTDKQREANVNDNAQVTVPPAKRNELIVRLALGLAILVIVALLVGRLPIAQTTKHANAQNEITPPTANAAVPEEIDPEFAAQIAKAKNGDAIAQYDLGVISGTDLDTALWWFLKSAEQGHTGAEMRLGLMLLKGQGHAKDSTEGLKWLTKAADQGVAEAQRNLGEVYFKGTYVPKDSTAALRWYLKAANQGDTESECVLGDMYGRGKGVVQDITESRKWYLKAAEQGNTGAMGAVIRALTGNYAESNRFGETKVDYRSVPKKDLIEVLAWVNVQAALGAREAYYELAERDLIEHELTHDQVVEAEKLASTRFEKIKQGTK